MIEKKLERLDFTFKSGEKLTSAQLNRLVNSINEIIDYINRDVIPDEINVNREFGDMTKIWTINGAIAAIPEERLSPGIKITFLGANGWEIWTNNPITEEWETDEFDKIDGGEW